MKYSKKEIEHLNTTPSLFDYEDFVITPTLNETHKGRDKKNNIITNDDYGFALAKTRQNLFEDKKTLDSWHPFNFIKRMDSFFNEFINPTNPEFNVGEFKDGRKESEKQEDLIRNLLISKNEDAALYGIKFKNRINEEDERSIEDIIIEDLWTPQFTEHLANIKSLCSKNKSNIGKEKIIGYALTGKKVGYTTPQITELFQYKIDNDDRKIVGGFYFYVSYKKDKKIFSTLELSYIADEDISVSPSNLLQSGMNQECVYRTSEERFEFLFDKWKTYYKKNSDGFTNMENYV